MAIVEVETRVNACTVHPQKWLLLRVSRRGEVAVCGGLTVFIYVKNVLCFIILSQAASIFDPAPHPSLEKHTGKNIVIHVN